MNTLGIIKKYINSVFWVTLYIIFKKIYGAFIFC